MYIPVFKCAESLTSFETDYEFNKASACKHLL